MEHESKGWVVGGMLDWHFNYLLKLACFGVKFSTKIKHITKL
jgi:hypothetical protein